MTDRRRESTLMAYSELCRLYPQMNDLTETVADCIRQGATIQTAVDSVEMLILAFVAPGHQQPVRDKLTQIAQAIRELHQSIPEPIPIRCPSCSSIETAGGLCHWCRNNVDEEDNKWQTLRGDSIMPC